MTDLTLENSIIDKKEKLPTNFIVAGLITLLLIVAIIFVTYYWLSRSSMVRAVSFVMVERVSSEFNFFSQQDFDVLNSEPLSEQLGSSQIAPGRIRAIGQTLVELHNLTDLIVLSSRQELIWRSQSAPQIVDKDETTAALKLLEVGKQYHVQDQDFSQVLVWFKALISEANNVLIWLKVRDVQGGEDYVLRMTADFSMPLKQSLVLAFRVLIMILLGGLILCFVLSRSFRRGVNVIRVKDQELEQQIQRLNHLLSDHKSVQNNMKTASARAVELNEQFLRRVGADLHDGPAQMIGYSVLRLNEVSRKEEVKSLGYEFHSVKAALEESLNEIRGISAGLVLPELAELNLEQCLRKVVALHTTKSDSVVAQYYSELPQDIPLPIKITAYRFAQEALNNAQNHGQATKCRLSAHLVDRKLTVSIKDNGIGFRKSKLGNAAAAGHLGIVGLRDRIQSLGGKLIINSELGVGTALKFIITIGEEI